MAKNIINSFNAGELSPYLYARSDFEKYRSGCLTMENFVPLPYGGATRRPSIKYVGDSKQDDKIRLIPFSASISASYVLELGNQYVRIWKDGALLENEFGIIELGSPWDNDTLDCLKFAQSVDVMWLVHPNHAPQRISRFSDTSWTIGSEQFDYPPLLEENDTETTLSPSGLSGAITITSSKDFFNEGHVGASFSFNVIRDSENRLITDTFTTTGITNALYVSNSNWEFSTTGDWAGRVIAQKSDDGGNTWVDYVTIGDTYGASSNGYKNFAFASDEEEYTNVRIRIHVLLSYGSLEYTLKTSDSWNTIVKITDYTDPKTVKAEVLDEFQSIVSDYSDWTTSTAYAIGDKVKVSAFFDYTTNNYATTLSDVTGGSFGNDIYYVTTSNSTTRALHELTFNGSSFVVTASHDLSSDFLTLEDVAYYNGYLFLGGSTANSNAETIKYSLLLDQLEIVAPTNNATTKLTGIENSPSGLYISYQYTTDGDFWDAAFRYSPDTYTLTGDAAGYENRGAGYYEDILNIDGKVLSLSSFDDSIGIYTEGLDFLRDLTFYPLGLTPKGLISDSDNLWIVDDDGTFYEYVFNGDTVYYECVFAHTSGNFEVARNAGYWSVRTPEMTTWSEGASSDYRGHPSSIALFESRLCFAGTHSEPSTIWASKIDDFSNFRNGSLDTDAIKITLNSGSNDEIKWLVPQERLVIGTSGSEWSLGASDERKPITPTGFDVKRKTTYGSSSVQAILVNSAILFLMRQGRKVREWTPNYNTQDYVAADLSILAEHITSGGICQWSYQQQPDSILWGIRKDGTLLGFTYERDQNVTGWHRHFNNEFSFESIAIIPRDNAEDNIYVSLNIDGKRQIGLLNAREWGSNLSTEWQGSDLWVNYQAAGDASHLIGKTVSVVVDGVIQAEEVVDGTGSISATLGTNNIVGLPFTSKLSPVYMNAENQYGTSQGSKTDIRSALVSFKDTFSAKVSQIDGDLESIKFDPDKTALYSEDAPVWFDNSSEFLQSCDIAQDDPMPCTVLALITNQEARR